LAQCLAQRIRPWQKLILLEGKMNTGSNTVQSSRLMPSIFWPVIMIVVGILALWLPTASSIGVARLLGWLMVFDGGFQFIHAFRSLGVGHVVWKVLVATIYLIAGIYFLMHPLLAVAVVTFALAIFFLVEGLVDVFSYFAIREFRASHWILVNGIVSIILSVMIWRHWPNGSLWVLGALVGIGLLMTGLSRLMIALAIRAYEKQTYREPGDTLRAA
jgi:uncharacterized membrane protein HdeD (DUF308 family)